MERCIGDLNLRNCLIYLYDVIIFSTTFEEHLERLDAVFSRLKEHNLKLKGTKCEFLKSHVTYLGHVVSENGIETDPEKTEAIRTWTIPKTVKDVHAFIGVTGFYRRFVKDYARIARPLNDLLLDTAQTGNQRQQSQRKRELPLHGLRNNKRLSTH